MNVQGEGEYWMGLNQNNDPFLIQLKSTVKTSGVRFVIKDYWCVYGDCGKVPKTVLRTAVFPRVVALAKFEQELSLCAKRHEDIAYEIRQLQEKVREDIALFVMDEGMKSEVILANVLDDKQSEGVQEPTGLGEGGFFFFEGE